RKRSVAKRCPVKRVRCAVSTPRDPEREFTKRGPEREAAGERACPPPAWLVCWAALAWSTCQTLLVWSKQGYKEGGTPLPPKPCPFWEPALRAWRRVLSNWSSVDLRAAPLRGDSRAHRAPGPRAAAQGFQEPTCKRQDRHLTYRCTT
ncbi:unnamed protein product, partial [Rangifer tarandus platyrhynchus]